MNDWLEIHALADEQLTADEKAKVQQRLAGCEKSRLEFHAISAIKSVLASRRDKIECQATWARCKRRLDEMDKANRIESFVGRYAWAICSIFLVFILSAATFNRFSGRDKVGASEVPRMAANMAPYLFAPKSQSSSDVYEFEKKAVGEAPVSVQPAQRVRPVVLMRGGSAIIDGRHHVRLDILDAGRPVTLYAVEGATVIGVEPVPGQEQFAEGTINDRNCVAWADGNYSVMLIGDEPVQDLCALAQVVSR